MKTTIIIATYFNTPHFIQLQAQSFAQHMGAEYDFAVVDDSFADTPAILSGSPAGPKIAAECKKFGVRHIKTPASVFEHQGNGGPHSRWTAHPPSY